MKTIKQLAFVIIFAATLSIISAISGKAAVSQIAATVQPATIKVSGVVTGPIGPVPDVWIAIGSLIDWQQTLTDDNGAYSITLNSETGSYINLTARPPFDTRLAQVNRSMESVTTDFTQDFIVIPGNLIDLKLPVDDFGLDVHSLFNPAPNMQGHRIDWDYETHRYRAVLPPDVYYVSARNLPEGYYETTQSFDLRDGDIVAEMSLNTQFVHPIPYDPPDAAKITFGPVDGLGEASITGAAGAVLPFANVRLVNLNSGHVTHVISEADGSFSSRLFAPPGSEIMVRHGPPHWYWDVNLDENADLGSLQFLNAYPNTIIHRSREHEGDVTQVPFATAGGIEVNTASVPFDVGAAFAITGAMGPLVVDGDWNRVISGYYAGAADPGFYLGGLNLYLDDGPGSAPAADTFTPGSFVQVESTIRLYGPAIDQNTNLGAITVDGYVGLNMLFDQDQRPLPPQNIQGSTRLTASGFPISHNEQARIWTANSFEVTDLRYAVDNTIEGRLDFTIQLPDDLPPGVYRPVLQLNAKGVPLASGWKATSVRSSAVYYNEVALPPIAVVSPGASTTGSFQSSSPELLWYLLMNDPSLGIRGTGPRSQVDSYQAASFIVAQGAPYVIPAVDPQTNRPISYRLEPFLPMNGFSDRSAPTVPRISFQLPGGQLCVKIQEPNGNHRDLGCEAFKQSFQRTATTKGGNLFNDGSVQIDDIYSLTTGSERFVTQFQQYGRHIITMTGFIDDVWGNSYNGGGVYDLWVARPLDIDPGVLPGTPLAVGDAFNPALRLSPGLPADVKLTLIHFPDSDPAQAITYTVSGRANDYGYFGYGGAPIVLNQPGEYRVELTATYTDPQSGVQTMGAATWGGIVMTPPAQADLISHGRRGIDNLDYIPSQWFVTCALNPPPPTGSVPHILGPYLQGDITWSRDEQNELCSGFALRLAASVQDTVGTIEAALKNRFHRTYVGLQEPGDFDDRVLFDELPLFSSTYSGRPVQIVPEETDQIGYAYLSAQRPGVRVREVVAEDSHSSGYWRLDSMYDNQPGVGVEGDLPNDYKFQYIGAVYRDLETDHNEYVGLGTGWIHLSDADPIGSRVMPPFSGPGNGGWPTQGGPLLNLRGEAIHMFIYPTGVRPGAVLTAGDTFHFAGHLLPALDSRVAVTVKAPSGGQQTLGGQANSVGYFYGLAGDFTVDEPGLWTVDVVVWHDGQIGSGEQVNCNPAEPFNPKLPCPSGNVLGSVNGRYWFYVVPQAAARLNVFTPSTGILAFEDPIQPITIRGLVPKGLSDVTIDYTISMPGFILEQGQVTPVGDAYQILFDPVALNRDFPNLDLTGRYARDRPGLADTFTISMLLQGRGGNGQAFFANSLTIQGEQLFVDSPSMDHQVFLPFIGLMAD